MWARIGVIGVDASSTIVGARRSLVEFRSGGDAKKRDDGVEKLHDALEERLV